jgi:hypothetical protein
VVVAYGAALHVPGTLGDGEAETWRTRVESAVASLTREVADAAGEAA